MAATYGRLQGNRGQTTRQGSKDSGVWSSLETWEGSLTGHVWGDGSFNAGIGDKLSSGEIRLTGNVDKDKRKVVLHIPGHFDPKGEAENYTPSRDVVLYEDGEYKI